MSGFAAIYDLDGRPVNPAHLERMSNLLAHRGPDDHALWYDGQIGLAHRLLRVTPESLHERALSRDPSGQLALLWDGRLDNRDELLASLRGETDPELVLAAYARWGLACASHLIGEFAFLLWDARARRLWCVRDRLGLRPLHHCQTGSTVVISSEIKPILAVLDRKPEPDEELIMAFLLREFRDRDHSRTFFKGVARVPLASWLLIDDGRVSIQRYWSPDLSRQLRYSHEADYVTHFREVFEQAVTSCARSRAPVCCALSGGLDSSAITSVAAYSATAPVEAVTAFGANPDSDERAYAQDVAREAGIPLHLFEFQPEDALLTLEDDVRRLESPLVGTKRQTAHQLFQWLRTRGYRVMLTGVGGDQVLDEYGYFADLLRARPWRFLREVRLFAQDYGTSPWGVAGLAGRHLAPAPLKYWGKRLQRRIPPEWINPQFGRRVDLHGRIRDPRLGQAHPISSTQAESYLGAFNAYRVLNFEVNERAAGSAAFELRYPMLDSRLIEFLLAIPWVRRTRHGRRKYLLCEALRDRLPQRALARHGKGDYSSAMDTDLVAVCRRDPPAPLENRSGRMDAYLHGPSARALVNRFLNGAGELRGPIWSLIALDHWLAASWPSSPTGSNTGGEHG